jgi:hypothetical protein
MASGGRDRSKVGGVCDNNIRKQNEKHRAERGSPLLSEEEPHGISAFPTTRASTSSVASLSIR